VSVEPTLGNQQLIPNKVLKSVGADECVNYKQDESVITSEIVQKTGGKMYRIFDAVGKHIQFSVPMFQAIKGTDKWFTTTNDW
jgi:NADPH:quinone reductase-like Zn-dependent oxidoreductase